MPLRMPVRVVHGEEEVPRSVHDRHARVDLDGAGQVLMVHDHGAGAGVGEGPREIQETWAGEGVVLGACVEEHDRGVTGLGEPGDDRLGAATVEGRDAGAAGRGCSEVALRGRDERDARAVELDPQGRFGRRAVGAGADGEQSGVAAVDERVDHAVRAEVADVVVGQTRRAEPAGADQWRERRDAADSRPGLRYGLRQGGDRRLEVDDAEVLGGQEGNEARPRRLVELGGVGDAWPRGPAQVAGDHHVGERCAGRPWAEVVVRDVEAAQTALVAQIDPDIGPHRSPPALSGAHSLMSLHQARPLERSEKVDAASPASPAQATPWWVRCGLGARSRLRRAPPAGAAADHSVMLTGSSDGDGTIWDGSKTSSRTCSATSTTG